jgi:hypothetical protein
VRLLSNVFVLENRKSLMNTSPKTYRAIKNPSYRLQVQTACGTYTAGFGIDEQLSTLTTASVNGSNSHINKQNRSLGKCGTLSPQTTVRDCNVVFWVPTPYGIRLFRRFGQTCCLYSHGYTVWFRIML